MTNPPDSPPASRPRRVGPLAVAGLAWVALAFWLFYRRAPLPVWQSPPWLLRTRWFELFSRPSQGPPTEALLAAALVAAMVLFCLCWAINLRRLAPGRSLLDFLVLDLGLCLGLMGLYLFFAGQFLGLVGLAPWLTFGLLLAGACLWPRRAGRMPGDARSPLGEAIDQLRRRPCPRPGPWTIALGLLLALIHLVGLAYALTPAIQSDALRYHLAAPQEWHKIGSLAYLPRNAFSNFPFLVEMLFLPGIGLGTAGGIAARGMHFLFLPLSTGAVALLVREIRRQLGRGAPPPGWPPPGLLAACLWSGLKVVLPLAGWAFIDIGVAFWMLAMTLLLLRWMRTGAARDWLLAAVFGGFLVGSKYTGVGQVFGAGLLLGFFSWLAPVAAETGRHPGCAARFLRSLRRALLFGLLAAAIGSPWYLRNLTHTGNPVYPFAWSVFGGGEWNQTCADIFAFKSGKKGEGRDLTAFLRLPWSTAAHPERFGDFHLGPLFWCFTPWWLLAALAALTRLPRAPGPGFLTLWAAWLIAAWFFSYQSNRFLLIPAALALAAILLTLEALARRSRAWTLAALIALAPPGFYSISSSLQWVLLEAGPWPAYCSGQLSDDEYLARSVSYYPAARFASARLGPDDKVLLPGIGEQRKYYWRCPVAGADWYDVPLIVDYLRQAPDADSALDNILADGFTHIFFNLDLSHWPADPAARAGRTPVHPHSAWASKRRHLHPGEIARFEQLLASPRLEPLLTLHPGRSFLARIQPAR